MDIEIKLPWRPMTEVPKPGSKIAGMYYMINHGNEIRVCQDWFWVDIVNWGKGDTQGEVAEAGRFFTWAYQDELCLHQVLQMRKYPPVPAPKSLWHIMPESPFDDRKEGTEVKITFLNQIMVRGTSEVQSTYLNHAVVSNSAAWQAVKFANKYAMRWAYSEDVGDALFDLLKKQERWV